MHQRQRGDTRGTEDMQAQKERDTNINPYHQTRDVAEAEAERDPGQTHGDSTL